MSGLTKLSLPGSRSLVYLLLLLCLACQSTSTPPIQVKLINLNKAIAIAGISDAILNDIDRNPVKNWENLAAVFRLPADSNLKDYQPIQPGIYLVKNGRLCFTPDTPFARQQVYFVRYYNYGGNKTIWQYIKGNTSRGQLHYIDLMFKPE